MTDQDRLTVKAAIVFWFAGYCLGMLTATFAAVLLRFP